MKASIGFIFFMLFLAGLAFVNLTNMKNQSDTPLTLLADLADSAWRPTHIGEMRLDDESKMVIQFNADHSVTGHSGCNRFFGEFSLIDGIIEIGPLESTRMACPEPANSFEISFLQALHETRSLIRADSRLSMRDDSGSTVARFVATERSNPDD